jgi:hypothetical protein
MFANMKSNHTAQHLEALTKRIALKGCGPAAVFKNRRASVARLRIANDGGALTERVAAAGTYTPTAAGERGRPQGKGRHRAARNEKMARGTPAPRQPDRTAEIEPHAGAVVLPGEYR